MARINRAALQWRNGVFVIFDVTIGSHGYRLFWAWFDLWVGIFVDLPHSAVYIGLLTLILKIN